jgi:hypothetical protein
MKIASFKLDVTPPVGDWLAYDKNEKIDTSIYIRGVILDDDESRAAIVSCDFLYIWGQTWLDWRKAIAQAAKTSEEHVFLHSIHQHDSVLIVPQWNEFKDKCGRELISEKYCDKTITELCSMIADIVSSDDCWQTVDKIKTAEKRIKGLGSNRRMVDENGKCFAMRWSKCDDVSLRALPAGNFDPLLRTIAFTADDGKIIAALHFYASHPMAAYRRKMVSQDVPGIALDYVAKNSDSETFNIYFTGCGGNVTFGKYNTGTPEDGLNKLGKVLGKGMLTNIHNLEEKESGKLEFATVAFDFPLKSEITEENMLKKMHETDDELQSRYLALRIILARNWSVWRNCTVSRMSIGKDVHFLSLPSEMCVEYQLYAQSLVPEDFLACAAYGNGSYHYIPTAQMYEEGGYEPEFGSIATAEVEKPLKDAIAQVLSKIQ